MRKRVLLTSAMMAIMLTISACGSKNTTETTTAVEVTTAMGTTTEESTTGEFIVTTERMESGKAEDLTPEQIKSFAEEIQAAVAVQDVSWLVDLFPYPVYVNLEKGKGSEIESADDFMATGEDKLFTEKLMTQVADVKPEKLEVFGADVIVGEDVNITSNNADGEPKIMGANL